MNCSICGRAFPVDDETIVMLDEEEDGDDAMHSCIVGNDFKPSERIACGRCAVEACRALHALVQRARVVGAQQRGNCDDHEHSKPDEAHECTAGAMVSSDDASFDVLVNLGSTPWRRAPCCGSSATRACSRFGGRARKRTTF